MSANPSPARNRPKAIGPWWFAALSLVLGVLVGLGAAAFQVLIAFLHNLMLLGKVSFHYDSESFIPTSPWGPWIILVPVVGSLGVTALIRFFATEAKGHGVPEVIDAIYYNKGVIRPIVSVIKSVASSLSIGSGGSVGREGAMIQIGSGLGSTSGQWLPMATWQRITLVAAGGGAGIAATFNTPIGAILFTIEIMMHEVSVRTLVPLSICTVTATYVDRLCFGASPTFIIPQASQGLFQAQTGLIFIPYLVFGLLMGLASALYIRTLYGAEDLFEGRIHNPYLRHGLGMLGVGLMMYLLMITAGHYYVGGLGYGTVQGLLDQSLSMAPWFLILLAGLNLLATIITLGSGGSGGIFSPALFMGATLGAAFGIGVDQAMPATNASPAAFALAGMAGIVAGATGAALAAIVMIFEMTRDYSIIIPMTLTVALSYEVRRLIIPQSIYTLKLSRRRHFIPASLGMNFHHSHRARDVMADDPPHLNAHTPLTDFARDAAQRPDQHWWLVEREGCLAGFVSHGLALARDQHHATDPAQAHPPAPDLDPNVRRDYITVAIDESLFNIVGQLHDFQAQLAVVVQPMDNGQGPVPIEHVVGLVTHDQIAAASIRDAELFVD